MGSWYDTCGICGLTKAHKARLCYICRDDAIDAWSALRLADVMGLFAWLRALVQAARGRR